MAPRVPDESQKPSLTSRSSPGIISATVTTTTTATITQGCTDQNFRLSTWLVSDDKERTSRPSICMKAGVGVASAGGVDGRFKRAPGYL